MKPESFTAEVVYDCLQRSAGDLSADITRARSDANMELFVVDYTKGQDRESIFRYRSLLQRLLLANSSAIFPKSRMIAGGKLWNSRELNGMLVKNRAQNYLANQMYALVAHMNQVKAVKKSTTSGVRLPSYLGELISLIDVAPDADDEDEEADGTQAQIKAQSGEQKEQNIQGFCELERSDGEESQSETARVPTFANFACRVRPCRREATRRSSAPATETAS